ncbi:uncharacterized protein PgNI_02708 [Pyricularia grisea]|uniref:Uncharacterized protein n=1 Tax=Pyricularia grisea TaxID=148305 RepID=A0A6P8B9A0_PYRGI|nr:uncharacterized protein PgNI_02708 [Pyricularia grisea]TLD12227.1 hypothetical protein PgNI_02708 [Pyricularia grisea]
MQAKGWGLASSRATSVSTQERMTPIDGNSYRWEKGLKLCQLKMRPHFFNHLLRYISLASRSRWELIFSFLICLQLLPNGKSFTAIIEDLSKENEKLCAKVDDLKTKLEIEERTRFNTEEKKRQIQVSQAELQFQVQELLGFIENLRVSVLNYCRGMDQVVPLLEDLKKCGAESTGYT